MANDIRGNYDGGDGNIYRLVIESQDESMGTFSGYFHDGQNNKWEKVSGSYHFFSDGRDETVLNVTTSVGNWQWESDHVNGRPSFQTWTAILNGRQTGGFYREPNTQPKAPTMAELQYGQ